MIVIIRYSSGFIMDSDSTPGEDDDLFVKPLGSTRRGTPPFPPPSDPLPEIPIDSGMTTTLQGRSHHRRSTVLRRSISLDRPSSYRNHSGSPSSSSLSESTVTPISLEVERLRNEVRILKKILVVECQSRRQQIALLEEYFNL